jgi:uncharacterized protein involved in tolerance to divalent cations
MLHPTRPTPTTVHAGAVPAKAKSNNILAMQLRYEIDACAHAATFVWRTKVLLQNEWHKMMPTLEELRSPHCPKRILGQHPYPGDCAAGCLMRKRHCWNAEQHLVAGCLRKRRSLLKPSQLQETSTAAVGLLCDTQRPHHTGLL